VQFIRLADKILYEHDVVYSSETDSCTCACKLAIARQLFELLTSL